MISWQEDEPLTGLISLAQGTTPGNAAMYPLAALNKGPDTT